MINKSLNIAILAPLKRPITPATTASRPHLIYELISRLIKHGHRVTIFGPGDCKVAGATVIPVIERGLSLLPPVENSFYQHTSAITKMLVMLQEKASGFDLIHNHLYPEFLPLILLQELKVPMLTTVHAQMTPDLVSALRLFPQAHLAAISQAHAGLAEGLKFDIVYNGIDMEVYNLIEKPTLDYLLFLGRMTGQKDTSGNYLDPKGVLTALEIAQETGEKLLLSGNVEDPEFYDRMIKPQLSSQIQFIGKVSGELPLSQQEVISLMQNAKALLFPINWEEPFGLVMVEANACGCPVLALSRGSVPEIIKDGVNGWITQTKQDLIKAVQRIGEIDRKMCRQTVMEKFSIERMVADYESIYYRLVSQKKGAAV